MTSKLKQQFTPIAQEFIPLGTPQRQSTNGKSFTPSSREMPMKAGQGHRLPQRSFSLHIPSPRPPPVPDPGLAGQRLNGLTKCSVLLKRIKHSSSKTPTWPPAQPPISSSSQRGPPPPIFKKEPQPHRDSAVNQREFAVALSKELNENLKINSKSVLANEGRRGCWPRTLAPASLPACREGLSQVKEDPGCRPLPVASRQHGQTGPRSPQSTSAGGSTPRPAICPSLKRRSKERENSTEKRRLCSEDGPNSSGAGSPRRFIQRVLVRSSNGDVLRLKEKPPPLPQHSPPRHRPAQLARTLIPGSHRNRPEPHLQTGPSGTVKRTGLASVPTVCPSPPQQHKSHKLLSPLTHTPHKQSSPVTACVSPPAGSRGAHRTTSHLHAAPADSLPASRDPLDEELGLGLGGSVGRGLEQCDLSSSSEEEEELPSLQEILQKSTHPPATPEKGAFSEPSTPRHHPETEWKCKTVRYKNTLDQMLQEKENNQRTRELEQELLESCREGLMQLEHEEEEQEAEEDGDGDGAAQAISQEQREFLLKFSVTSNGIRDVHPGEELFTPSRFGRLFSQQTLDLRTCAITPGNRAQDTLLRASPAQVLLLIRAGLLNRAYSSSPCPPTVARWLFQMMSVHPDPVSSSQLLQGLQRLALTAAQTAVERRCEQLRVWVPAVQDVALVFLNMGVSFISLFPLERLRPPFTEGDLLESAGSDQIAPGVACHDGEPKAFPLHNFENVIKYVTVCVSLCPREYSDTELLLLLTLVCKLSLDTQLVLLPSADISRLLHHLLRNMSLWPQQLVRLCPLLADLSEDHHNLRHLVQILPRCARGRQLRRHLSLAVISKLLPCSTYKPASTEFQLSKVQQYLPLMRPSCLLKSLQLVHGSCDTQHTQEQTPTLDQQAYYLCYSLLALLNEASNFELLPSDQKSQLMHLSSELDKHIKSDIRESERWLYRCKVKDFVARIDTKWRVLLQTSTPLKGKLYECWQPLPEDVGSLAEHETHSTHTELGMNTSRGGGEHTQDNKEERNEGMQDSEEDSVEGEGMALMENEDERNGERAVYEGEKEEQQKEVEVDVGETNEWMESEEEGDDYTEEKETEIH